MLFLCLGAVATSAPVFAELNFKSYLDVVTASLQTTSYGKTCTDSIAGATEKIQSMVTSDEGRQQLSKIFRFALIILLQCNYLIIVRDVAKTLSLGAG
jgi:hypothetical protein